MNTIPFFSISILLFAMLWGRSTNAQETPLAVQTEDVLLDCFGDTNGGLVWTVSGGTAPYTYQWSRLSNAFVFAAGSQMEAGTFGPITGGLEANTYLLKITDATGAMVNGTAHIVEPPPIQVTDISVESLTCATVCDGRILMEIGGGTGAIAVTWADSPSTSPNRSALCTGEYLFFLTDEQGCSQKGIVEIDGPPPLELITNRTIPSCAGAANGSLQLQVTGGMGEYDYEWATGGNVSTLVNATAGSYPVTVSDANNCLLDTVLTLPDGPSLLANPQIGYGCGDGQILVATQPINGVSPYTYQWSTGATSSYLLGMSAGMYALTLTDNNGCEAIKNFTIAYVPPLSISASVADVSCFGAQDGAVNLQVSGGQPPFALSWSNGANGMGVNSLAGGEYTYVLSAAGCGQARSVIINEPSAISTNFYFDLQTNNLITAFAQVQGGIPPYQYLWSNGQSSPEATNLSPTTSYSLTVTDATNCSVIWDVQPALTSTEDVTFSDVQVFPNPHQDQFTIQLPSEATNASYRLLNLAGQEVLAWNKLPITSALINTTFLPAGCYVLEIQWGNEWRRLRVVKG
jgi:hypothetical protein